MPAAAAPPRTLRFESLNRQADVPTNTVLAMLQDKQGFIWMGTQGGLYRYDGQRSAIYRNVTDDARSLPGDYVASMLMDAQNRLWFGTNNGLALYDPVANTFTTYRPPALGKVAANQYVRTIVEDGKGGLWLGTMEGLQHFDPASARFERYRTDPARAASIASDRVNAIARDAQGGLWLSVWPLGIDYLAPGSQDFQHYPIDATAGADPKTNSVNALRLDEHGQLWIGTANGVLLWKADTDWATRRRLPAPAGYAEFSVYSIYRDRQSRIWVGTQPAGLLGWDPDSGQFTSYHHQSGDPHSLPSSRIPSILVDRSGTLWAGSWDAGVSRVDLTSQGFDRFIPSADGGDAIPQGDVIGSLSRASEGRIWLGGPGGVRLFDTVAHKIVRGYRNDPKVAGSLPNNFVITVLQQPGGPLWVGTGTGLNRLDKPDGPFQPIRFADKAANFVRKIVPARDGKLWVGTDGGLLNYDPASGAVVALKHDANDAGSRSADAANAVLEDSRGRLWVGNPYGFGLDVRLRPPDAKFTHYRQTENSPGSLSNDFVTSLYEDEKGRIWVGTANGLNEVIEQADGSVRFRAYTTRHGLAAHDIFAIEGDHNGHLWLLVTAGLTRFDPATGAVLNFSAADGLTDGNFVAQSALLGGDGVLYFGSFKGLTTLRPSQARGNAIVPQVAVTDISVMNRSLATPPRPANTVLTGAVTDPKSLILAWDQAVFSIEFAAMHFADPERNRYAYQLTGFDRDWVQADAAHRVATYTNLDPGTYTFHVKAANKNGLWDEAGLQLPITILPPFWATWWFRLAAALLTTALLALLFRWRVRILKQDQQRLEQLVFERTSELAGKNAALSDAYTALENLSVTDPLTGLRNRRFLDRELPDDIALALRRHETAGDAPPDDAALIFFLIDLDHFKMLNDHYGHAAGDLVLTQMRQRLQPVFRETDYLVRWGGEEFLAVARGANRAHGAAMAERVRAAVAETPFILDDGTAVTQSCSIGYACFPFDARQPRLLSWQQIVRLADLAMYAAKRGGRAAWVGMACGPTPLYDNAVQQMLQSPAQAVARGTLLVEGSIGEAALRESWDSLP